MALIYIFIERCFVFKKYSLINQLLIVSVHFSLNSSCFELSLLHIGLIIIAYLKIIFVNRGVIDIVTILLVVCYE